MTQASHPFVTPEGLPAPTRTPLLTGTDPEHKRRELLAYFCQTFDLYDSLFECLADERAWFNKAIPLRHPLIFYYGHTAAFFVNKLLAARLIEGRLDPRIEAMVAIGVDEMSWDDLDETHYDWPSVSELRAYRGRVRALVVDFIEKMPIELPIGCKARPGHPDGDRARAHPSRDLQRADPPAAARLGAQPAPVAGLPRGAPSP